MGFLAVCAVLLHALIADVMGSVYDEQALLRAPWVGPGMRPPEEIQGGAT